MYTRLDYEDFKILFPAFSALEPDAYDLWVVKAEEKVGESYLDKQQTATELMTAHLLALNGVGIGAAATLSATGATSFKSGTFSASISEQVAMMRAKGGLSSTPYGQQIAEINRDLFGGPHLVGGYLVGGCAWTC